MARIITRGKEKQEKNMARIITENTERKKGNLVKVVGSIVLVAAVVLGVAALAQPKDTEVAPVSTSPVARYDGIIHPAKGESIITTGEGQLAYQYADGTLVDLDGNIIDVKPVAEAGDAATRLARYEGDMPSLRQPHFATGPDGRLALEYSDGSIIGIDNGELIRPALQTSSTPATSVSVPAGVNPRPEFVSLVEYYPEDWVWASVDGKVLIGNVHDGTLINLDGTAYISAQ